MDKACTQTLSIEKLVQGGYGFARMHDGAVAFVSGALPGETVIYEVDSKARRSKSHTYATTEQVLTASPERVTPQCGVFGVCGGCDWQMLALPGQRSWKEAILIETLKRIGGMQEVLSMLPILPLEADRSAWHYRNKVIWHVAEGEKAIKLGYYAEKSHEVVSFDTCWIIPPLLNQAADWLREHLEPELQLTQVQARINQQEKMLFSFFTEAPDTLLERWNSLSEGFVKAFPSVIGVTLHAGSQKNRLYGEDKILETLSGKVFSISETSFFQVNIPVAEAMISVLRQWFPSGAFASLLDCYAGVGTFSVCLEDAFESIVAIESHPQSVLDAQENIRLNGCRNIEILQSETEKALPKLNRKFEAAILDPPRSGCNRSVLDWVSINVTRQLVYIACDPATLSRDIRILLADGWRLQAIQPLDMFPQTHHLETMVLLTR